MQSIPTAPQAYQSKLYSEFSSFYDLVFARVFYPRIARVIRSLNIPPGARVLEIGVGTGMSLGCYPTHCKVIGIDLAPDMLEHAQAKIDRNGWSHLQVMEMDAMDLDFPASSFDYVMGFHVVSVVPDAGRLMSEAQRVLLPGGTLTLINHFRSGHPLLARLDRRLEPVSRRWGWHTLDREEVFTDGSLAVEQVYKMSRWSLFTIVVSRNEKSEDLVAAAGC